ncbi:uncharacterized protein LOC142349280 isoform X3 [Convolutriloba macropyga]|uniref:uncharacterized protein LOC142349280 isoform X3 n=1 Tax=Convolutriloba macropyga TaxID=536237 RepID=UPI003F523D8B
MCFVFAEQGSGCDYWRQPRSFRSVALCERNSNSGQNCGSLSLRSNIYVTSTPMLNGPSFLTTSETVIAAGLIDITRQDNLWDYECPINFALTTYYRGLTCRLYATYKQSFVDDNAWLTSFNIDDFIMSPYYDPGATKANIIQTWKAAGSNVVKASEVFNRNLAIDDQLTASIFNRSKDAGDGVFVANLVNNIIVRIIRTNADYAIIANLSGDSSFTPVWAVSVTWYKVAQGPEIIDKQNTFQLVIACSDDDSDDEADGCYSIYDYYQLEFVQDHSGQFMRAGVTGLNIPNAPIELPGSGSASAADLVTGSNVGTPGLWVIQLNQTVKFSLSVHATTENTANISMTADDPLATINDVIATCSSTEDPGCPNVEYEPNSVPLNPATLQLSGLRGGSVYNVSINSATVTSGNPAASFPITVKFCTKPTLAGATIRKLNDTAIELDIGAGSGFDHANLSFTPADLPVVTLINFSDFPITIQHAALNTSKEYNVSVVLTFGTTTDCGESGVLESDTPFTVFFYPDVRLSLSIDSVSEDTANISIIPSDPLATVSNAVATCNSSEHIDCTQVQYEPNTVGSNPGYLELSGLRGGSSYEITVTSATIFSSLPQLNIQAVIKFCTDFHWL